MAIQKPIDINNTGVTCEVWRVDNVPIFRSAAIIRVFGWLDMAHYTGDTKKVNSIQFKEYQVVNVPGVDEQLDTNGEPEIPAQPEITSFTDYFSDAALLKKSASPLKNGYEYLLTLPEFAGGTQV